MTNDVFTICRWQDFDTISGPYNDAPDNVYTILKNGKPIYYEGHKGKKNRLDIRNNYFLVKCLIKLLNEK